MGQTKKIKVESRNHNKNGAYPKSHTSRKTQNTIKDENFKMVIFYFFRYYWIQWIYAANRNADKRNHCYYENKGVT